MSIKFDSNGDPVSWNYSNSYNSDVGYVSFVTYDVLESVWKNRNINIGSMSNQLTIGSDNFDIKDTNNNIIATMSNGVFSSNVDGVYESILCDVDTDYHIINLSTSDYTVVNRENTELELSMMNGEQYAEVKTQANTVRLFVDDSQAANVVDICGAEGDKYEVAVNSGIEFSADKENTVFKGACTNDVATVGTSYGQPVCSGYSRDGIYVNGVARNINGINDIDINNGNFTLTLSENKFDYDGSAFEPEVYVTNVDDTVHLTEGVDYTVVYYNNVYSGKAEVEVYGINKYVGMLSTDFNISGESEPKTVTFASDEIKLVPGKTANLLVDVAPSDAVKDCTFSSNESAVATVDENGVVTASKTGTAIITATTVNGLSTTCRVEVTYENVFKSYLKSNGYDDSFTDYEYKDCYSYFAPNNNSKQPDWLLIYANVSDDSVKGDSYAVCGDYVLKTTQSSALYELGYYVYVPKNDKLYTLNEAFDEKLSNIDSVFTSYLLDNPNDTDSICLIGDNDGDGVLTIIDATYHQRVLALLAKPKPFDVINGTKAKGSSAIKSVSDYNRDGFADIVDVTAIQRKLSLLT